MCCSHGFILTQILTCSSVTREISEPPCHAVQSQRHNSIAKVAAVVYRRFLSACLRFKPAASLRTYTGTPQTDIQLRTLMLGKKPAHERQRLGKCLWGWLPSSSLHHPQLSATRCALRRSQSGTQSQCQISLGKRTIGIFFRLGKKLN